jgi:hypothetical protein
MSALRQKMIEGMQLKGVAVRTQEAYVNAVLQLSRRSHPTTLMRRNFENTSYT